MQTRESAQPGDGRDGTTAVARAAVVVGAGGGIGRALVEAIAETGDHVVVHALSRGLGTQAAGVRWGLIDVTNEDMIRTAAAGIGAPLDLVIVATGMLHQQGYGPERALRDLDPAVLARVFAVNAIGPALVLKHFSPLLARDRPVIFALLSARVGSITDNRSGGWYGYRASKAALNMIVRSAAIEISRSRPHAVCVGLHPRHCRYDVEQAVPSKCPGRQAVHAGACCAAAS